MTAKNQGQTSLKPIGEINCCPYCKEELKSIPSRKKKCPYCGEYIYVRTRPVDRKKVLITEKQRGAIERQWSKYYEEKEWKQLLQDKGYQKEKNGLNNELGRDPTLTELKLRVTNKQMIEFSAKRQWGLYRNSKLDIAQTLEKEGNLKGALSATFEVCYLDINGANNVMTIDGNAMPYTESEKLGIKDFDRRTAFFAPALITWIKKWMASLNLSESDAKTLFIETNERNKPFDKMPINPKDAWEQLKKKIEENRRIDSIDISDQHTVIKEIEELIKQNKMDEVKRLLYKNRSIFTRKKYKIENVEEVKAFIKKLMSSKNRNLSNHGQALMVALVKNDESNFASLANYYVKMIQANFNGHNQSPTLGQLAAINVELIKTMIPTLKETIKKHNEWNSRRFAAFNLGSIGEKHSELVRDIIPVMINYIKKPFEVTKHKPMKIEAKGMTITMDLSPDKMLGVDQTQWLKDAYIDTLGMFARGDKGLIQPYRSLFEILARKDKSEYTRKKAQRVLDILDS